MACCTTVAVVSPSVRTASLSSRQLIRGAVVKHRSPVAKGWRTNSSSATRSTVVRSAAKGDDEMEEKEALNNELNFNLPSDLGQWQSAKRVRSISWGSLEELSTVHNGKHVYILVFGAGTGSEGVYSLQERTREDIPVDIILAFRSYEDASRYATLLEAEMGRVPIVEAALPEDLMYTCQEGGYRCKVARRGVLLVPPEKTVAVTDWERANALRQGQWTVAESDEGCAVFASAGTDTATCSMQEEDEVREEAIAEGAQFDLEASRAMLSRLYSDQGSDGGPDSTDSGTPFSGAA